MDLRWLSAPEQEVAEAMALVRRQDKPSWVPNKRQLLIHVNHCIMLWCFGIVSVAFGIRIDTVQENRIYPVDIRDIVICAAVFAAWIYCDKWLFRWAARPPSAFSKLAEWRQILTALANGFEPQMTRRAAFSSMLTTGLDRAHFHPRFVAEGIEFGNLGYRRSSLGHWHYLAVKLPVPLPHLVFETTAAKVLVEELPVSLSRHQRLSLEGDFDRTFRLYVPTGYGRDALFVVTPDLMAALVDHAPGFNIEIVDDHVTFFVRTEAYFTMPEAWLTVESLLSAAESVVASARRYRDDRILEQQISPTVASMQASLETPETPWVEPTPRIDPQGRRLTMRDRRKGTWPLLTGIGWFVLLAFLYVIPASFAFAGVMSVVDGR